MKHISFKKVDCSQMGHIKCLIATPDNKTFEESAIFFAYIGYITQQVALIDDEIKKCLKFWLLGENTRKIKKKKISEAMTLLELVTNAKYGSESKLATSLKYALERIEKINEVRNLVAHTNWVYWQADPNQLCAFDDEGKIAYIVTAEEMKKWAIKSYEVHVYTSLLLSEIKNVGKAFPTSTARERLIEQFKMRIKDM